MTKKRHNILDLNGGGGFHELGSDDHEHTRSDEEL